MRAATLPSPSSPRHRVWLTGVAGLAIALMAVLPAAGASASTGSIPPDVSAFAADDDGLLLELEEFFGVNQRGTGLDFSDGIELGEIDRVFLWSKDFHSGVATDTPVQYVNRWKVPLMIGDEPVGVALIGFDPATVEPEMIDFIRSPGTALALDHVDNDATLIHEPETGAWFSLVDGVITPLVRGSSDVAGEISLTAYQPIVSTRLVEVVEETPQPDQGSVQSVVLIVTTVLVVLLALLVPTVLGKRRERRERRAEAEAEADADAGVAAEATAAELVSEAPAAQKPAPQKSAPKKSAPKKPAAKKPATKKPTTATAATTKSATKKPAASKASSAKPVPKKPATTKSAPAKKPAASKPAATQDSTTAKRPKQSPHTATDPTDTSATQ